MTAHVAEKGEGRGRVVLRMTATMPASDMAITAAMHVAKAFNSEIESLFVEDRQIFDAAGYAFVREMGSTSVAGNFDVAGMSRWLDLTGRALTRRVETLAKAGDVPVLVRHVRDTPLGALASACQRSGPWNVVALSEAFTSDTLARLGTLFARVTGMTGVVLVGPRVKAAHGPIIAVIEDVDRVTGMLRTANRLANATGAEVVLAVAAGTRATQAWMEEQVRLMTGNDPAVRIVGLGRPGGGVGVIAEALRLLRGGFIIAEQSGLVLPPAGDLRSLVTAIECPLLIVR